MSLLGTFRKQRISAIWLVPGVALLATLWLGYRVIGERGPRIEITLDSAEGIEVGKTKIRHRDIELGVVESMTPDESLHSVTVSVHVNRYAEPHLTNGTSFWVVRPRLSAEGISGLSTILSGSYIEMSPGIGSHRDKFIALTQPPVVDAEVPGTHYTLQAKRTNSINQGAPISFHGVKVGEVLENHLSYDTGNSTLRIFVRAPYDQMVRDGTRFWNASGISIELAGEGLKLRTESLQSILTGGIAFDIPVGGQAGERAKDGSDFILYNDAEKAREALYTAKLPFILNIAGSAQGLNIGSEVRLRGIRVGEVVDVHMEFDPNTQEIFLPTLIEIEPQRIKPRNIDVSKDDIGSPAFRQRAYQIFGLLVEKGLRARVASGNVLTGQKYISLDFIANSRPTHLDNTGSIPELPMASSVDMDAIFENADALLRGLTSTVTSVNALIGSPQTARALVSLNKAAGNLEQASAEAGKELGPLMIALKSAANSADTALKESSTVMKSAGTALAGDGLSNSSLPSLLSELQKSSHSIHVLVDYLEGHPSSVVWGKDEGRAK